MELTFEKQTVPYLQRQLTKVCEEEQTQELIVPDSYPDVGRVISCNAEAVLHSKEVRDGLVSISGATRVSCLYLPPEGDTPQALDSYLPFTLRLEDKAITESSQVIVQPYVRSCDARILNSRKLMLRASVCCRVTAFVPAELELGTLTEQPSGLEVRCNSYPLRLTAEVTEKIFSVQEDLPANSGSPAQKIVSYSILPEITDKNIIGAKVVCKGNLNVKIVYLAEDGRVQKDTQQVPFSQYLELQNDPGEDAQAELYLSVTNSSLEKGETVDGFSLEADLLLQCAVSTVRIVTACEDAYATEGELQATWKSDEIEGCLDKKTIRQPLRETFGGEIRAVLDENLYLGQPACSYEQEELTVTVPVQVHLLCQGTDEKLQVVNGQNEVSCRLPLAENASAVASCRLLPGAYANPSGGGAEVRAEVEFFVQTFCNQTLQTMQSGSIEPVAEEKIQKPAIIVRRCGGNSVWELAKQYRTKASRIIAVNRLPSEEIEAGTLLLICR